MAQIQDIVFDCTHPASLARFWATVLDDYAVAPYDEAELTRLRREGILDPGAGGPREPDRPRRPGRRRVLPAYSEIAQRLTQREK